MLAHLNLCFNRLTHKYIYSNPLKPNIHFQEVHYSKEQKTPKKILDIMIAELIIPIETLKGQLRKDGYYFRMYKGKQIVQRCPNRSGHVKKEGEAENQQRFIKRYRKKKPG